MLQVEARASARRREHRNTDPVVLRQRAFAALRELLTRMAARQPLVVYIDDLHWADVRQRRAARGAAAPAAHLPS
jgi:predicted ATPase